MRRIQTIGIILVLVAPAIFAQSGDISGSTSNLVTLGTTILKVLVALAGAAGLLEDKRGAVSAYVSCFPGQQYNVRKLWLRGDHKANLSFAYSPFSGHSWSDDLEDEYTLIYETRQSTPFFFTPFVNGNGNTTVLGPRVVGRA